MIENKHLTNEFVVLDKIKVQINNLMMNNTYFLDDKYKVEKSKEQQLEEFVYQTKMAKE
jgi:hypothetical protein